MHLDSDGALRVR